MLVNVIFSAVSISTSWKIIYILILAHSKKDGGEKLISVYPELIAFAIWLVSLTLLTILRRIHVKNRKLEQIVTIKLSNEDVAQIEKIVDSKLLEKIE